MVRVFSEGLTVVFWQQEGQGDGGQGGVAATEVLRQARQAVQPQERLSFKVISRDDVMVIHGQVQAGPSLAALLLADRAVVE